MGLIGMICGNIKGKKRMNVVMIVPTGLGCEIGGHAGDATPAAKLLASVCDNLVVHPNVVNASDINEQTENMWYVEGGLLDEFLNGHTVLRKVRKANRVFIAVNSPMRTETHNAINASRVTMGADVMGFMLITPLVMKATIEPNGSAGGTFSGHIELIDQLKAHKNDFDALAINTLIDCPRRIATDYFNGLHKVNPWGGIEAKMSRFVSNALHKPTAHAPIMSDYERNEKVSDSVVVTTVGDPRMAAEMISTCFLHCVIKGLHTAPRIIAYSKRRPADLTVDDIDLLVSPSGCWGLPHAICHARNIPVLSVKENSCIYGNYTPNDAIQVENYWEAAGYIAALKAKVTPRSVRRPLNILGIWNDTSGKTTTK